MKKILLIGSNGQVGWELQRTLAPLGQVLAFDREKLSLDHPEALQKTVREVSPNIIINAAAYTAVDKAENEAQICKRINSQAPGILAEEAKRLKALLIQYSTDYVFDGNSPNPYQENDQVNPLNVYGQSKLEGEKAIQAVQCDHLILRTSWVYAARGKNFLLTMLRLAKEKDHLKIVNDQVGAPTWSRLIAETTAQMITIYLLRKDPSLSGIYHVTASGKTSWFGFAEAIFQIYSKIAQNPAFKAPQLQGIPSVEYSTPARRPQNSVLSHQKLNQAFQLHMPNWRMGLEQCISGARSETL